jgi:enoyl-CoA hydratase/carnithine racemase
LEARLFGQCAATADFAEGMASFMEKREPRFLGR